MTRSSAWGIAARRAATLRRCFPDASDQHIAAGTQAALGLIHSVAYWPTKLVRGEGDLPDFLCRLVTEGLSTLGTPAVTEVRRAS